MTLFENPVARIKRISMEIKQLNATLEHSRLTPNELRDAHKRRADLIQSLDDLEKRTRKPAGLVAAR